MRDKGFEIVCGGGKKYFVLGRLEQPRQNKGPLYRHDKPNEPTKEGLLSFVLFESPFNLCFKSQQAHPSLDSLDTIVPYRGA
jgi:hypothetical protein